MAETVIVVLVIVGAIWGLCAIVCGVAGDQADEAMRWILRRK